MSADYRTRAATAARYAVRRTALVAAPALALASLTGTGWVGVEYALFVVGTLGFGYGALAARPPPPWRAAEDGSGRNRGFDVLLASVCVLALSLAVERLLVV